MNWDKKTLGEIYEIEGGSVQTGPFGSQLHEADYTEFGVPVIMPKDIIDDKLDLSGIAHISEDDAKRLSQHIVKKNDIICPRRGEIGKRIIIEDDNVGAFCGTGCIRLRGTGTVLNQLFFFYFLKQPNVVKWVENQAIGATMMNLNTSILKSIPVKYPPLPTQQKIASILSAYDELIENNKQRIKLLEEMAEGIYKEWFVRLRFPNYENTEFVDGLPKGWEKVRAETVFNINIGKTPPREESQWFTDGSEGLKWVSIRDIGNCSVFLLETNEGVSLDGVSKFNMNIAKKDTVILSFKLTVGKIAILHEDMVTNEAIAHFNIRDSEKMNREYTYCYLKNFKYAELGNTSSIGNAVNSKIVKNMPIIYPSKSILNAFGKLINPFFEEIKVLSQKNQLLQQTSDLLLPRLISGKLSVEGLAEAKEYELGQNAAQWPMAAETEGGYKAN